MIDTVLSSAKTPTRKKRNPLRVKWVEIKKLFGIFNHEITLNNDERVTIIGGPNGYGKTTILRMITGLISGNYSTICTVPFESFVVYFSNDSKIVIKKMIPAVIPSRHLRGLADSALQFDYYRGAFTRTWKYLPYHPSYIMRLFDSIDAEIPDLVRIGYKKWRSSSSNEIFEFEEIIDKYGWLANTLEISDEPSWLRKLHKEISVHLIDTKRLQVERESSRKTSIKNPSAASLVDAVATYSNEIVNKIQKVITEYAELSQTLDRTFPLRIVEHLQYVTNKRSSSLNKLHAKLVALEKKRSRLMATGLLNKEIDDRFQVPDDIGESIQAVLAVYVRDAEEKLQVFDNIARRIELFKRMVNERFLYKEMTISSTAGIQFITKTQQLLPPTKLSSGEQHELVLLYQMVFNENDNSLFLIDEPEISLHVAWQEQFLLDIRAIAEVASADFIIATHSPEIVYDNWNLLVELKGPSEVNNE